MTTQPNRFPLLLPALAGLCLVGVTFGMARYGYGLFLPQFIKDFGITDQDQGRLASASYAGYLTATVLAAWLASVSGPRMPIVLAGLSACIGTVLVANAESALLLGLGIVIAGASPGFVFPALSEWVSIIASDSDKNRLFAIMNSGTGAGVFVASPLSLYFQDDWRSVWLIFAVLAVIISCGCLLLAPGRSLGAEHQRANLSGSEKWLTRESIPLLCTSLITGFVTAIFWTFAVKAIVQGNPHTAGSSSLRPELIFWMVIGLTGFIGAFAGDSINRQGMGRVLFFTLASIAVSMILLGSLSSNLIALMAVGALFGASFIYVTGVLGVWSLRVFTRKPSMGFGLVFFIFTLGAMFGPTVGALALQHLSPALTFNALAGLTLLPSAFFIPKINTIFGRRSSL